MGVVGAPAADGILEDARVVDGTSRRIKPSKKDVVIDAQQYFMKNPSLSGRGEVESKKGFFG